MPTAATRRRSRKPVEYPDVDETPAVDNSDTPKPPALADDAGEQPAPQVPALRPAIPTDAAGVFALAVMQEDEFEERLLTLKRGRDRIAKIQRDLMEVDVDYGLIPGTPKPTLFKPGAEKLALIYGLAARVETSFVPGDGEKTPPLQYTAECFLHLGSFEGAIVAVGHGTANSWEKRYRRDSDKLCPSCGKAAIIKSKFEPGWYCFPKKGGCGSKFAADDEGITSQVSDPRGDPTAAWDLDVTLLKMAEKRAFVDAVLRATASSSLFTQDLAEEPVAEEPARTQTPAGNVVDTSTGELVPPDTTDYSHDPARQSADGDPAGYGDPVEVQSGGVGPVERGGKSPTVTTAQIDEVRRLSKELWGHERGVGPYRLADEIASALGGGIDSTELDGDDPKAAAEKVMDFLTKLEPTDMGSLITHLKRLATDPGYPAR